jgi:hypothetical protein
VIASPALTDHVVRQFVAGKSRGRPMPLDWAVHLSDELLTEALGVPCSVLESRLVTAIRREELGLFLFEGQVCVHLDLAWRPMPLTLCKGASLYPPPAFIAKARRLAGMADHGEAGQPGAQASDEQRTSATGAHVEAKA